REAAVPGAAKCACQMGRPAALETGAESLPNVMGRAHSGRPEQMMLIAIMERFRAITPLPIGAAKLACGSKESNPPFPFPPRGKPGRGGFPPRRKHAARQQKALSRIDAAGSPHKRAAAPLCIPRCATYRSGAAARTTESGLTDYEGDTFTQIS